MREERDEELISRMERRDRETHDDVAHYKTLGVDTHLKEIAKAYRRAALEWHPASTPHKFKNERKSPQKCSFASTKPSKPSAVDDSRNVKTSVYYKLSTKRWKSFNPPQNFHPPVDPRSAQRGKHCSVLQLAPSHRIRSTHLDRARRQNALIYHSHRLRAATSRPNVGALERLGEQLRMSRQTKCSPHR